MTERFDDVAKQMAESVSRRKTLLGVAALAFGALGFAAIEDEASAKNKCNRCKNQCRDNNKNKSKNNKKNCSSKCRNKCRNK